MSLSFYLFYMVLFVGLFAWIAFLWIAREREEKDEDSSEGARPSENDRSKNSGSR